MRRLTLTALVLSLALLPAAAPPVGAAKLKRFKVVSLDDAGLAAGGKTCVSTLPDGKCTLRAAIQAASNLTLGDAVGVAIKLKPGTIMLTLGELGFKNTTLAISVTGRGANRTVIDGGGSSRVIDVCDGVRVSLAGLTIRNGQVSPSTCPNQHTHGAGIHNHGVLTIDGVRVVDNAAATGFKSGGGITNAFSGDLTVHHSAVADNAADNGGGIENLGTLRIQNSTISTNTANVTGGGIWNNGINTLVLRNVTVTNNTVGSGFSGGLEQAGGAVYAANTIIIDNRRSAETEPIYNCIGVDIESDGSNLEDSDINFACFTPKDVRTDSPGLGPLQVNPGKHKTETHALLAGSPAIDAGDDATCAEDGRDQRGKRRKDIRGVGAQGVACDIGAYEYP